MKKPDGTHYYKDKIQQLRNQRNNKCELCQSTTNLQFAHTKPTKITGTGRGRCKRYHDIKNNPEHYILLCKKCHIILDHTEQI